MLRTKGLGRKAEGGPVRKLGSVGGREQIWTLRAGQEGGVGDSTEWAGSNCICFLFPGNPWC